MGVRLMVCLYHSYGKGWAGSALGRRPCLNDGVPAFELVVPFHENWRFTSSVPRDKSAL